MMLLKQFYEMIKIPTPQAIVDKINNLSSIKVQHPDKDFLNKYFQDNTRLDNGIPLFVSKVSGDTQLHHYYRCTYYSETKCQAQINVSKVYDTYHVTNGTIFDHNHFMEDSLSKKCRNAIPNDIKEMIKTDTENGLESSQIRIKNNFSGCSHKLYNIRRQYLCKRSENDIIDSLNFIDGWVGWSPTYVKDESGCIRYILAYNDDIPSEKYSEMVHIIDDTVDTTIYGLALIVTLIHDPNSVYQIGGFGFLDNKSVEAYEIFFKYLKINMGNRNVNVFITDRSIAQRRGFLNIYPDCDYIYCKRHLQTNLKQNLGNSKIYRKINYLYQTKAPSKEIEEKLLQCSEKINTSIIYNLQIETTIKIIISHDLKLTGIENRDNSLHLRIQIVGSTVPITTFAKTLIEDKMHWMPEFVDQKFSYNIMYTNPIEGFFGNLKCLLGNKKRLMIDVVTSIKLLSDRRIQKSLGTKRLKIDEDIISEENQKHIGNVALKILKMEYNEMQNGNIGECKRCSIKAQFHMICRHDMIRIKRRPILVLEDINPIYLLKRKCDLHEKVEKVTSIPSKRNTYSYYISRLSDIVSSSQNDYKLRNELDEFLEKCESRKKEVSNSGIKVYKTPGAKMNSRKKVDNSVGIKKNTKRNSSKRKTN